MSPITSHVLDTALGQPARGLRVQLAMLESSGAFRVLAERSTDEQGRVKDFLPPGALTPGTYQLVFETGPYLSTHHGSAFYPQIEVRFQITNPAEHYHVPLLLSPYGYSTYRGS